MRRLGLIAPLAVILVALCTAAIVLLGPEPYRPASVPDILLPDDTLVEVRDRWALLAWWVIAIVMSLAFAFAPGLTTRGLSPAQALTARTPQSTRARILVVTAGVLALGIAVAGLVWAPNDHPVSPLLHWHPLQAAGLPIALLLVLVVAVQWRSPRAASKAIAFVGLALLAVLAIPALYQPPGAIRDVDSFRFVLGDLLAVSNGQLPLGDFFPLYTSLLGLPIAPLITAFPEHTLWVVTGWLMLLQASTVALAIALVVRSAGRRMALAVCLVVVLPLLRVNELAWGGFSYFAIMPVRLLLPLATLVVAARLLASPRVDVRQRWNSFVALGALAGLTFLNNPDFGGAALAAVLIAIAVTLTGRRAFLAVSLALAGIALGVGAYLVVILLSGHSVALSSMTVFQRLFAESGYFAMAMQHFGPHVPIVALFVTATVIAFVILVSRYGRRASLLRERAIVLLLCGLWSLLCLPYFAGRSVEATLGGGFTLPAAITVAAFLPFIRATALTLLARIAARPLESLGAAVLGMVAVLTCLSGAASAAMPSAYVDRASWGQVDAFGPLDQQVAALNAWRTTVRSPEVTDALSSGGVQILLPMSVPTSTATGLPSQLVLNDPLYFGVSAVFSRLQCAKGWPEGTRYVLMYPDTALAMAQEPTCAAILDFGGALTLPGGDREFTAVPVRDFADTGSDVN